MKTICVLCLTALSVYEARPNYPRSEFITLPLIPQSEVIKRRYLKQNATEPYDLHHDEQVAALYQGYGTHYVDLWVGTPPQRQTVIVDTGSQLTAFPCHGCKDCGDVYHTDHYFDMEESSTFQKLNCSSCDLGSCDHDDECRIHAGYKEGSSWTAFECNDIVYAGGSHNESEDGVIDSPLLSDTERILRFTLLFGCQTSLTGLFLTQLADGIMGMMNKQHAFWNQMYESGVISKRQFSLCFQRSNVASHNGTLAGAITFGGRDERLSSLPMMYSAETKGGGYYGVHLRNVFLWQPAGEDLTAFADDTNVTRVQLDENKFNKHRIIVDSGTTKTILNKMLKDPFAKVWKGITGVDYSQDGMTLTPDQIDALPTFLFQFKGVDNEVLSDNSSYIIPGLAGALDTRHPFDVVVAMPPSNYLLYSTQRQKFIPTISFEQKGGSVFGANFMMGHDVLFDMEGGRIGWAQSDCNYLELQKNGDGIGGNFSETNSYFEVPEINETVSSSLDVGAIDDNIESFTCNDKRCAIFIAFAATMAALQTLAGYRCYNARTGGSEQEAVEGGYHGTDIVPPIEIDSE